MVGTEQDPRHYGYHDHKDALARRLHRIEGQVRGIERMIDEIEALDAGK